MDDSGAYSTLNHYLSNGPNSYMASSRVSRHVSQPHRSSSQSHSRQSLALYTSEGNGAAMERAPASTHDHRSPCNNHELMSSPTPVPIQHYPNGSAVDEDEDGQEHYDYRRLSYPALRIANAGSNPDVASITQDGDGPGERQVAHLNPSPGPGTHLTPHSPVSALPMHHQQAQKFSQEYPQIQTQLESQPLPPQPPPLGARSTPAITGLNSNYIYDPQCSPRAESVAGYWGEGLSGGTHDQTTFVSEEPLSSASMHLAMSGSPHRASANGLGEGGRAMSVGDGWTEVSFANRGPNVDKLRKVYYRLFTHSSGAYASKWRIHADDPSLAYFHHDHIQPPRRANNYIDFLCAREGIHKTRVKLFVSKHGDQSDLRQISPSEAFHFNPKNSGTYIQTSNSRSYPPGSTPEDPLLLCVELPENAPREMAAQPIPVMTRGGRGVAWGLGACCKGMVSCFMCALDTESKQEGEK